MRNKLPSLPLTFVIILGIAWIGFFHNDTDADLFGHVTIGERILDTRAIPATNTYSYTEPDHPWINQYWLSEVIFALIYRGFGNPGLILFMMAMSLGMIAIAYQLIRKHYPQTHVFTTFIVLLMTIGTLRTGITIRPQLFTYLFTMIMLYQLTDMKMKRSHFILLPVLFLLWANLHGGVIAGYGILFIWSVVMVFRNRKSNVKNLYLQLTGLWGLSLLAFLVNPYGWNLIKFLLFATRLDHGFIREWKAINWFDYSILSFKLVLLIYLPFLFYGLFRIRVVGLFVTAMSLITLLLAITHVRHTAFFALTLPIFIPRPLNVIVMRYGTNIVDRVNKLVKKWVTIGSATQNRLKIEYLLAIFFFTWFGNSAPFQLVIPPEEYPISHVKWFQKYQLKGNLLSSYDFGYYLIRELYPSLRIASDGRYETCYSVNFMEKYLQFYFQEDTTLSFLIEYPPDWILLEPDSRAAWAVYRSPNWKPVNWNKTAVLFAHRNWLQKNPNINLTLPRLIIPNDILFK